MDHSEDKYRGLRQLPPFPAVATKLLRVLSEDDIHLKEIVGLIRADPALASELMRVVNSAIYGFPSRISSIQNAVTLLGLTTVRSFALTVSMKGFLHTALRLDLLRRIWRHSLACGMLCEEISAACSTSQGGDDRAYTAGLLHNVGRLGLFVAHPKAYADLLTAAATGDILERERELFGLDHCEAGAWLAHSWGLPGDLEVVNRRTSSTAVEERIRTRGLGANHRAVDRFAGIRRDAARTLLHDGGSAFHAARAGAVSVRSGSRGADGQDYGPAEYV